MANLQNSPSAFFDVLSVADELNIKELTLDESSAFSERETKTLNQYQERVFLLRIRNKKNQKDHDSPLSLETQSQKTLHQSARLLIEEKDFVLARNIYSYLSRRDTKDLEATLGLGICLLKLGEWNQAAKCFHSLSETELDLQSVFWMGMHSVATKNETLAKNYFEKITNPKLLSTPDRFEYYKEKGNCDLKLNSLEEAWVNYHHALEVNPLSDLIYTNLGTLEMKRTQYSLANAYFKKALELNPKNAKAFSGLGLVCLQQGNVIEAKNRFIETIQIDSSNIVALNQLIQLTEENSELVNLEAHIRTALEREPSQVELMYQLAFVLFRQNHASECDSMLDQILAKDPHHVKANTLKQSLQSYIKAGIEARAPIAA